MLMKIKINFKKNVAISLLLVLLISLCGITFKNVFADEATDDKYFLGYELEGNLYSETNTFTYNEADETYDFTSDGVISDAVVSDKKPLITVLTHGLGGDASHWSNNGGDFAPDSSSIISKLNAQYKRETGNDANIYWAKVTDGVNLKFNLIPLTQNNVLNGVYDAEGSTIRQITDISKHIIIVFEATETASEGDNKTVYEQFNYVLSKIIYDVKWLNNKVLPKINLIGHSRGGITNLQYALDHPHLVHSMFAIGTPFFGSSSALTTLGSTLAPGEGREDIVNRDVFTDYYNSWIDGKTEYYQNIKAYAIGGYSDTDFLFQRLIEGPIPENTISIEALKILKEAFRILRYLGTYVTFSAQVINQTLRPLVEKGIYTENELSGFIQLFSDVEYDLADNFLDAIINFFYRKKSPVFKNDLLVGLASQLGIDSHGSDKDYGFTKYKKQFTDNNCNTAKRANPSFAAVVHNLGTRDSDFINYIVSRTEMDGLNNNTNFYYTVNDNSEVIITGLRVASSNNVISIPAQIGGRPVVEIGYGAFNGESAVGVVIPSSVESIASYAFTSITNLTNVTFSGTASLSSIGTGAFAGCSSLSKFGGTANKLIFPSSMTTVSDFAFANTGFNVVTINSNMSSIGTGAFAFTENLTAFEINGTNPNFEVVYGVLYSNQALLQYPSAKTGNVYNSTGVNPSIKIFADYAFAGNKNIVGISFPNVEIIGDYAFLGCEKLGVLSVANVTVIGAHVFEGTAVNLTNSEYEKFGKVLYKYNGTKTTLSKDDLSGVATIASYAFSENTTLTEIYLPNSVEYIQDFAFDGCSNLVKLQIERDELPTIYGHAFDGTSDNFKVFCRKNIIDGLRADNVDWHMNKQRLSPIVTQAYFIDLDQTVEFYFGSQIEMPEINITGKQHQGWQLSDENGNIINQNYLYQTIWLETTSNVYYKADLIDIVEGRLQFKNGDIIVGTVDIEMGEVYSFNKLSYVLNGNTINFEHGNAMSNYFYEEFSGPVVLDGVTLATFTGWYIGDTLLTNGTWSDNYSSGTIIVNATWEPVPFTLTLVDDENGDSEQTVYYHSVISLESCEDMSDKHFVGWKNSNGIFISQVFQFTQDTEVVATWDSLSYAIYYKNLTFNNETATLIVDNNTTYMVPTSYFRGTGVNVTRVSAFFSQTYPTSPTLVFLGWYTNMNFTDQVTYISTAHQGDVTLYAKWRYDYGYGNRTYSEVITTENQLEQDSLMISLGLASNNLYQNLLNIGIKKLCITLKISVDPSYNCSGQQVYLYGGTDGTTLIQTYNYSYTEPGVIVVDIEVDLQTIGANSVVFVRFRSASGTWENCRMFYGTTYCVVGTDKNSPEFTWDYEDPF